MTTHSDDALVEAIARAVCRCGRYETGEGTCAVLCMESLGDARGGPHGCPHAVRIHGKVARAALAVVREREGWQPPIAGPRDQVMYRDYEGRIREGVVTRVETTYGYGPGIGPASHTYSIIAPGRRRKHHVGGRDIVTVFPHPPDAS